MESRDDREGLDHIMKFRFGDIDLEARFEEGEPRISPHTGAPLRSGTLSIITKGDDQHEVLKRLTANVIVDGGNARWRIVRLKSWTTRSGSNLREDHLQVESDENRIAETLSPAAPLNAAHPTRMRCSGSDSSASA